MPCQQHPTATTWRQKASGAPTEKETQRTKNETIQGVKNYW